MTEEQLANKSIEDLRAIATTMQFLSAAEAESKSREEILAAITGVTSTETPAKESKKPAKAKKTTAKAETKKSTTKTESKSSTKTATTKAAKAKKTSDATKEAAPEAAKLEEPSAEVPKAKKTAKKTTSKKSAAKSDEKTQVAAEVSSEPAAEVPTEVVTDVKSEAVDADKPAKKPARKNTKSKKSTKAEAEVEKTAETDVADAPIESATDKTEEAPADEKKPAKKSRSKKKTAKTAEETPVAETVVETAAEDVKAEPATETTDAPAEVVEGKSKRRNSKKRRISFGPSQETKEVEIPADEAQAEGAAATEEQPAPPPVPEIVYTEIEGVLSVGGDRNDFCGFVHKNNYLPGEEDAYVSGQLIKRLGLRKGDYVKGLVTAPGRKEKYAPLKKVISVNGIEVPEDLTEFDTLRKRPRFEQLTAVYPNERLTLENGGDLSCRIIDLFSPIGKGQRGMIVSPPKAGKTILMQKIANAITTNNPEAKVMVLLIDERPEEVTDMQRHIKGEVAYSTFDKRPENHVRLTELVLERAMRLVELGQDVVILLDSMTRLGRAYNLTVSPSGRTLSGGLDPASLYGPKRFFGAARNIENGGSLTIIATALIETGSKMDEVIFEEFKGTGNMEVVLDRKLADRRVYPAIAVDKSGTRREDLLLTPEQMESVWLTRKAIADVDTIPATEAVINFMKRTSNNDIFVLSAKKSFAVDK